MNLQKQELSNPKRSPGTIKENLSPANPPQDSLIARGWQREQYLGIAILFITLIAAVGLLSRRFEYALLLAFALSIALIVFFLTI